ncbi:Alpha/Beta hydrolase protein [Aspergillus taichungensis]|uniref:Alpha/Beta hydrolase protein n=1 Tax=Aspergillus taichungensis TaxID=482145 RepID=A0A2J5HQC0_9EURO|nr:Alpha/Beta hydrolase protein [Aspergillus taichungensis]
MADPLDRLDGSPYFRDGQISSVSRKTFTIAGIQVTVFGLDELPACEIEISCIWLLHPRLSTKERMSGIANEIVTSWNKQVSDDRNTSNALPPRKGVIAIALDHRNHGTRLVEPSRNGNWREGNARHADDMYNTYHGTAQDVSMLIDHLPSAISVCTINQNVVLGVSLGGYAAWHCILHDPRITAAVVIIGSPDYMNLMVDRARLSKLPSWKRGDPPGSQFLHSESFPSTLIEMVHKYDPACLFLGGLNAEPGTVPLRKGPIADPTDIEKKSLRPLLMQTLGGKQILNISGGRDKAIPYPHAEAFLNWLKRATAADGWFADGAVNFEDILYKDAAHEVTPDMAHKAVDFIMQVVARSRDSKRGFSHIDKPRI